MTTTKHKSWLLTLKEFVEETESPRPFWMWGGIFTIASALERKVWIPFGLETIYPNLYVLLVAPPGKCRKGSPLSLAKKFLVETNCPVFVDSPTKRALTKQLAMNGTQYCFSYEGNMKSMSNISLISKELSSFLAMDPKGLIEVLTDLWDSHDVWEYKTSEKGEDNIHNLCVSCFLASTPSWIAANLPEEAIGGGFTSRLVIVYGHEKYKRVPLPPPMNPLLRKELISGLMRIKNIVGPFELAPEAEEFFVSWYNRMDELVKRTKDERLHGFIERIHTMALKVAMSLHAAYSDERIILASDIESSVALLEDVLRSSSKALSGQGRSKSSVNTEDIMRQLMTVGTITFAELMQHNFRNTSKWELEQVLESIEAMGHIKTDYAGTERIITWKTRKEKYK